MTRARRLIALTASLLLLIPPVHAREGCVIDDGLGKGDCIWVYEVRSTGDEWVEWECNDGEGGAARVVNGTVGYYCGR